MHAKANANGKHAAVVDDSATRNYAASLRKRGYSATQALSMARKWRVRQVEMFAKYRKRIEAAKAHYVAATERIGTPPSKEVWEATGQPVVQTEDVAPGFAGRNVALIVSDVPEQVATDIYQVLSGLRNTKYYKLDTPDRVYRIVGWYCFDCEIRFSIRMKDEKELTAAGRAIAKRYVNA